jgi:hypothetical protein
MDGYFCMFDISMEWEKCWEEDRDADDDLDDNKPQDRM